MIDFMLTITILVAALCAASIIAMIWGYESARREVAKCYPHQDYYSIHNKLALDPFIWSGSCPPNIRRRYIMSCAGAVVAGLGFAYFVWRSAQPNAVYAAIVMVAIACGNACLTGWKMYKFKRR